MARTDEAWRSIESRTHDAAIAIARRCRRIIQTCLREEEWPDADREFYLVAREILDSLKLEGSR